MDHPAPSDPPVAPPPTAIVGAGHVGRVLAAALAAAGWPVTTIVSRDVAAREALRAQLGSMGTRADTVPDPTTLPDEVGLVLLTVPDDSIVDVAARVPPLPGRCVVHTSGVHPASVLRPAVEPGMPVGSLHPLVAFADTERARAALPGAAMAIDRDPAITPMLEALVRALGGQAVLVPSAAKPIWHAAAVLSAGGVVALLDVIAGLGAVAGLDTTTTWQVFLPLMRQAMDNVEATGTRDALTGPIARGDRGTVALQLAAIHAQAPDAEPVVRALLRRQATIAGRDPDDLVPPDPAPPDPAPPGA